MPTTITLDGVRRGGRWNIFSSRLRGVGVPLQPWGPRPGHDDRGQWLTGPAATAQIAGPIGDVWSDDTATSTTPAPLADFTAAALGWGVLAFAVGTAALRGYSAVKKLL